VFVLSYYSNIWEHVKSPLHQRQAYGFIYPNAMVTNHLRAPYGVYFTKNRTILRRPAGGRKNRTIFEHFLRHRTVPGEV